MGDLWRGEYKAIEMGLVQFSRFSGHSGQHGTAIDQRCSPPFTLLSHTRSSSNLHVTCCMLGSH